MNKTFSLFRMTAVLALLLLFTAQQNIRADVIPVNNEVQTGLTVTVNDYNSLKFNSFIESLTSHPVKAGEDIFTLLHIEGYGHSTMEGEPRLPVLKRLIEVPLGSGFSITIINAKWVEIDLAGNGIYDLVLPAQPPLSKNIDNPEDVEFIYHKDSYLQDQYLGSDPVTIVELGIMRGVRLARLEIAPATYNPVRNKIRVCSELEVEISFTGADMQATLNSKQEFFSPFFEGIYGMLLNYKNIDGDELITDEPVTYVIVSDPMFETTLQPFVEWKTKKGFHVIEAYTNDPNVGNTNNSIKSYLQNLYNTPPAGVNPQSFVLFVGDVAQISPFSGTAGGHVTDLYFCEYTGDLYPECFYGRFSANNVAELQPQIDKTLEYEQYLMPDPSFLDEVVMASGADASHSQTWGNGQINYGTTYYFNAAHGLTSHTYLQPEPGGGNYSQQIRQNVSDGVGYANYTAHCSPSGWADPSFTVSHVAQLTNAHKYPLMVGNCCSSNDFTTTCFGEALLRAVDKGALGYIGGSNSTYWDEDFWWGVGFESISANPVYNAGHLGAYDRTFHDHAEPLDEWYITQGQMNPAGNLAVTQSGSSMETYYWEIYHLMGDPSLMVYFSQPPATTANYQALMPLASPTFTVNTDPYAYVAISKNGVLHGAAIADQAGVAEVVMMAPITVPGVADVVITRQNGKPFIGTVNVSSPTGPYVLFSELSIDDSNGNNNGMVDYSEEILLDITLQNLGSAAANNLTATLSTTDEYITINDATHTWPNIPAGGSLMQPGAFKFTVDNLIPDQHIAFFDLEVTNGSDTWISTFNIVLNAPVLEIGTYSIDDSNGNNNGRLDPGENANLIVENHNNGHCNAPGTMVSSSSSSNLVTLNTSSFNLNTLEVGIPQNAIFNITISPAAQVGDLIEVEYLLESAPYSEDKTLMLTVGLIVEDFESGDFETFDWQMAGNADWTITQLAPYEGVYSAKSGAIDDYESSVLLLTVDVEVNDEISFFRKVSSESSYDYLKFYIDGSMKEQWSGEQSWQEVSYPVTAGQHTFKWEYSKDVYIANGSDCAWLDYIILPSFATGPAPLSVNASATPDDICEGESSLLYAFASGGSGNYTFEWSPQTGLSNPNIQNPVATPESTTTYTVTVDDGSNTVSDEVTLTVNPVPATPAITQQGSSLVSSAVTGNQWYNSGGAISGATSQVFYPGSTENYYVVVTNQYGCPSEQSNSIYFIFTGIRELVNGEMVNIYPVPFGEQFFVDYVIRGNSDVRVSLYNAYGQEVNVLSEVASQKAGTHRIEVNSKELKPGVYFCRIDTDEYTLIKRILRY
ncbi:MAG: T9SS type A sorting domain-containing protein [Bacteroidales bacterium]|nr:T9SS type A sorting domain-containing protein [Bacteroidales bacterium]